MTRSLPSYLFLNQQRFICFLKGVFVFALLWLLMPYGARAVSDEVQDPIELRMESLSFTPNEFYIAGLVDERKDPSAVAWLIPLGKTSGQAVAVDLKGGGKTAMENFLLQSLPRNKNLRPVIVRIKEFHLKEHASQGGVVEGELTVHMVFDFQKENDRVHLVDFQGGMRYKRSAHRQSVVEPTIRRALGNAMQYLNDWMEREAPTNVKLATGVKVILSDYVQNPDSDTVFYSPDRPLRWEDFQAKPRSGKYAASVFPSFAWEGGSEVVNGVIHLHLITKVFVLKHSSWVRQGARNAYGLNHEQRHFDIVKLVVERFKQKILTMDLSPDDFEGIIGYQYIESFREMNNLQDAYDEETRHGINSSAQEEWNRRIDKELREFGVIE